MDIPPKKSGGKRWFWVAACAAIGKRPLKKAERSRNISPLRFCCDDCFIEKETEEAEESKDSEE